MSDRECGIPNCDCAGGSPPSQFEVDTELAKRIKGLWDGLGLKKGAFALKDHLIKEVAKADSRYVGDQDPFRNYDTPIEPMNWGKIEGVRWIETNKPDFERVSAIDMIPGADGPYCPPNEPKTKAEADSRVEWVLANLCPGEHARLYKLLHDGHGIRVESCDTASKNWKKGLS